jgi:2-aminoadipate transaminase
MLNYEQFFSTNAKGMKKNEIRELLKLTRKPGIISFAGGLPAPDLFPVKEISECTQHVLETEGKLALQYGPTEGNTALREQLLTLLEKEGIENLSLDQLFVITSSQQGLDLVGKVFVDPGDIVLCGKPTYVGAIQAFNSYGGVLHGVELDELGISTEALEKEIKRLHDQCKRPKFVYVVPDFQNPSGITLNLDRRKELIALAEKYDLIIIEDSPYRQLRFEGEAPPPLISLNSERVIALYSFSKILLPGFRLGWMAGPTDLIQKLIIAKQAVDLCAPPFNQAILAEFMKRGHLERQIAKIRSAYKEKCDFMLRQMDIHLADVKGISWTRPEGGLFLWVTLPETMDSAEMFLEAVEKKVAYVMGSSFDPDGMDKRNLRLNFSFASMAEIETGIQRLAEVIKERFSQKKFDSPVTP